ncbi:hypothetical protein [Methylobacterium sp. Leaf399]|uniref:hypothetical protein n=1 Tax=Methylobacterium sp. Leaf399 TaxID=1736364 RepID=UPI000B0C925C|nr:hypothetical protein [Methylobacterium sp. Leaf399]
MTDSTTPTRTDDAEARAKTLADAARTADTDLDKNEEASEAIDRATAAVGRDEG